MSVISPLIGVATLFSFWLAFLAKGSLILLAASVTATVLRKMTASLRHNVWLAAVCAALLMPFAQASLPAWRPAWLGTVWTYNPQFPVTARTELPITPDARNDLHLFNRTTQPMPAAGNPEYRGRLTRHSSVPAPQSSSQAAKGSAHKPATEFNPLAWLFLVWGLGATLLILRRVRAGAALRKLVRMSASADMKLHGALDLAKAEIGIRRTGSSRLMISDAMQVPCTIGFFRPIILLPTAASEWPASRLRAVLLHELTHVRRLDCLWLLVGQIVRALYWPNPLAWLAASQLRSTCEEACDNRVLRCGRGAADYADDLVAIAESLQLPCSTPVAAVAMARPSTLKYRVLAILDEHRSRRGTTAPVLAAIMLLTVVFLVSIATLHAGRGAAGAAPTSVLSTPHPASTRSETLAGKHRMLQLVITGQTGRRIGGAKVYCTLASDRSYWIPITTTFHGTADSLGRIAVPIPRNRLWPFEVHVQAPHHVRMLVSWRPKPFNKPIKVPSHLHVMLPRGTRIGGIVLGPHGNPAVGVHVFLQLATYYTGQRFGPLERVDPADITTVSTAGGKWSCDEAPSRLRGMILIGDWSQRFVTHTGNKRTQAVKSLAALRDGTLTLKLQRGVKISGTILGPDGQPLAHALVGLGGEPRPGYSVEPPPMATDSLGRFSWVARAGKLVTLTAWAPHCAPQTKMFKLGATPRSVSFHLEPGRTVKGRVLNGSGKPISGAVLLPDRADGMSFLGDAYVQMAWMSALRTNGDGQFVWHHAPPGALQFDVTTGGCATVSWTVEVTSRKPRLTLYPPVRIRGTVVDAKTGLPVKKFTEILGNEFTRAPPVPIPTLQFDWPNPRTGHNGRLKLNIHYTYTNAGMGLLIQAPGYKAVQSGIFHRNQAVVHMRFAMVRAPTLLVKIINNHSRPVGGATAVIVQASSWPFNVVNGRYPYLDQQRMVSNAKGYVRFVPQRGKFRLLVVSRQGYADLRQNQLPKSGVVRLIPWAKIIGHVAIGGTPVAEWRVTSNWRDFVGPGFNSSNPEIWMSSDTKSDHAGNFVLKRIPEGRVRVSMYKRPPGPNTAGIPGGEMKWINIKPGQIVHVSLTAPRPK